LDEVAHVLGEVPAGPCKQPLGRAERPGATRRINDEHRIVYMVDVEAESLFIAACRFHYSEQGLR
jgi:hypothetical protein